MPRSGWSRAHSVYCSKFKAHTSLTDFKKKASRVLTTQPGRKCSIREFKNEAIKLVKTLGIILEENTLFEAKVYNEVKTTFLECIREVASVEVGKAKRTRKVPNEKVNHLVLEAIARALGDYVHTKPVRHDRNSKNHPDRTDHMPAIDPEKFLTVNMET